MTFGANHKAGWLACSTMGVHGCVSSVTFLLVEVVLFGSAEENYSVRVRVE